MGKKERKRGMCILAMLRLLSTIADLFIRKPKKNKRKSRESQEVN